MVRKAIQLFPEVLGTVVERHGDARRFRCAARKLWRLRIYSRTSAAAILGTSGMNKDPQLQAVGVDKGVNLAPFDLLPAS